MQESVSMTRAALFLAACVLAVSPANASAYLSEEQARAKAVKILTGDPYGTTTEDVLKTIVGGGLLKDGRTQACGNLKRPVWQFHIHVETPVNNPESPIDGYLALDAVRGKLICANLPMLD
jgi:hypothetical protein